MKNPTKNLNDRATFLIEYLDLPKATGIPDATWETFQIAFLNADNLFDISTKARQIGWSWIAAADAVANSILHPNSPHVFVSISQDEAREKIRYAQQIMAALDSRVRPTNFPIENQTEIELPNGSRLISNPCKPPRGKGRLVIYLDEFAHYPIADEIYTAAIPVTTRGGRVRVGSTPLGAQGKFWEIYDEAIRPYPGFTRRFLPWWVARGLCTDVKTARKLAPKMTTQERVASFGTSRLRDIFDNVPLVDFQQEYECAWLDETQAWITWEEIKQNQMWDVDEGLLYQQVKMNQDNEKDFSDLDMAISQLRYWQERGQIERTLRLGADVGRRRNVTEIILVGADQAKLKPYRAGITLDRVKFETQEEVFRRLANGLHISLGLIDDTGLGMQLAENMSTEFPDTYAPVTFTTPAKRGWATETKLLFQRGQVPIPLDRDLGYQIHSVKKTVTGGSTVTFGSDRNDEHHADKFWALALATDDKTDAGAGTSTWGTMPV